MTTPTVATPSAAVQGMQPDWDLVRALLGGTRAMRAAGKQFLPQWPNEDRVAYDARLAAAWLFPAYQRTVTTLAGKPFSKPVTVGEDVPERFKPWLVDIDQQGRNLHTFAGELMHEMIGAGLCGILVDYPDANKAGVQRTAAGAMTQAAEQAAGLRPYMIHIHPWQILGWRAKRQGDGWVLTQLRLMEEVEEDDGEFATKCIKQVRVLEPGTWRTFRKSQQKPEEWVLHEEGTTTLNAVPFVPLYGERTGFMTGKPPLVELAHMNVRHWQSQSDQDTILHVARVPILTVIGAEDQVGPNGESKPFALTVGASAAVQLPLGASLAYVEHTGAAIGAGAEDLNSLEERMRQAGAELLVIEPGKITATQVATENEVGMCALQRITLGLEGGLAMALQYMADWVKEPQGGHVKLFNDFGSLTLTDASAQLLKDMATTGLLSKETVFHELQRRGIVAADVDWEEEQERIEADGPPLGAMTDPLTAPAGNAGA